MQPRLFLIDTYGFIFRAYHARARMGAPPMRTSTGLSTEAVYIFTNMVRKLQKTFEPRHMAAVFESLGPTFRDQEFAEYKANRTEMPHDLGEQIPYVRRVLEAMRIPILEYPGFEADDVIGTLAHKAAAAGFDVVIVSSDKDMMQLVTDRVNMLNPAKDDAWYDAAAVKVFMGVEPHQVADLLALKGDAVDNIPGAPGIGDKGAKDLIEKFGSLQAVLDGADQVERKMYRESLQQNRERILMSKRLATIACDVPVPFEPEKLAASEPDVLQLRALLKELEFHSMLRELGPAQDERARQVTQLETPDLVAGAIAAIPPGATVAIARHGGHLAFAWQSAQAFEVPSHLISEAKTLLEASGVHKVSTSVKSEIREGLSAGVAADGFLHDVSLYAFLLDADPSGCSLEQLVQRRLDLKLDQSAGHHALYLLELLTTLRPELETRGLHRFYEDLELPLAPVLARMEHHGIRVDPVELLRLSELMDTGISRLTSEIHGMAGREFNIASPQQLGKVLFEEMQLPAPVRYGKGKTISTAADVLEELAAEHPVARKVLEYRSLTKLKGTYVDALPSLIDGRSGRIHTRFNQTGAATGRLSSSDPNLQNIPIKTELGREIRAAFVPEPGWKLIVADYSQIELRLLAHFSKDPVLLDAFRNGEDIHTRTAAEVLGIPPLLITREQRNSAKAVNFGIVYGISPFGLSAQLGISRKEAEQYIANYFERYAGVRRFIDDTIAQVKQSGITRTLLGRERPIPDMNSRNPNSRGFAERTAVNSPLQGTAADLIKLAMIHIDRELKQGRARLLLQVHDELVLEAPADEAADVAAMVKREMENVHRLAVPLLVDTGIGDNWRDAK
jgi:DNA polymerase-1